jgi:phosphoribosylformimino-5-aminoimidazole carboxamide ribotide isomerase
MQYIRRIRADLALQASGGVASLDDLVALKAADVSATIVGRALYEQRFTVEAALAV